MPFLRQIPLKTLASTVYSQTATLIRRESLNKSKSTNSSPTLDPKSCAIKTINFAGKNIFPIYPVKSMIQSVGSKNTQNFPVISMTPNVGENFFLACHATSKILNAGENFRFTQEKPPLIRLLRGFKSLNGLWMKKEEGLGINFKMLKNLPVKRQDRLRNLQKMLPKKQKKKLKGLLKA